MGVRTLVEYYEDRMHTAQQYDFKLQIDRSAAGQPGIFVTATTEAKRNAVDGSGEYVVPESEVSVVVKDGLALFAPVLAWLLTDDLVWEVAEEDYNRQMRWDRSAPDWEHLPDSKRAAWYTDTKWSLEALIAVGQRRKEADTTEDGH